MNRFPKTLLLALLRGYKQALSPFFPPACRYVPTCSEYAAEAIELHGAFRGSMMAAGACCDAIRLCAEGMIRCRVESCSRGLARRTAGAAVTT